MDVQMYTNIKKFEKIFVKMSRNFRETEGNAGEILRKLQTNFEKLFKKFKIKSGNLKKKFVESRENVSDIIGYLWIHWTKTAEFVENFGEIVKRL